MGKSTIKCEKILPGTNFGFKYIGAKRNLQVIKINH